MLILNLLKHLLRDLTRYKLYVVCEEYVGPQPDVYSDLRAFFFPSQ